MIHNFSKYVLVSALALTACPRNQVDVSLGETHEGSTSTYMNVVLSSRFDEMSRADGDVFVQGEERDYAVRQMFLFMKQEGSNELKKKIFGQEQITSSAPYRPIEAWQVDASKRYHIGIFTNLYKNDDGNDVMFRDVADINFQNGKLAEHTEPVVMNTSDMDKIVRENSVAMISLLNSNNKLYGVYPGVTKEQAEKATADVYYNNVPISLVRIVAKAAVQVPRRTMEIRTAAGEYLGDFTFEFFGVASVADKFYLVEDINESGKPSSPTNRSYLPIGVYAGGRGSRLGYVKYESEFSLGDRFEYGNPNSGFTPLGPVPINVGASSNFNTLRGVYVPENIQGDESIQGSTGTLRWSQVTHFKIYGKVKPNPEKIEGTRPDNWDGTFYFDKTRRKFTYSPSGTFSYQFYKGRGFYRALLNCMPVDADYNVYSVPVQNADVRRNRFYVLEVNELLDLPSNWDDISSDTQKPGNRFSENDATAANEMFIAKDLIKGGYKTNSYDGIKPETTINRDRLMMRTTTRVASWHSQLFSGSIGNGK